jgi:hypothetical protein
MVSPERAIKIYLIISLYLTSGLIRGWYLVARASLREVQLYLVLFVEDIGLPVKKKKNNLLQLMTNFVI